MAFKKTAYKISDFFDYETWSDITMNFEYQSHVVKDSEGVLVTYSIFPEDYTFIDNFMIKFGERSIFLPYGPEEEKTDGEKTLMFAWFVQDYFNQMGPNMADMVATLDMFYNPIHNYDGHEESTTERENYYGHKTTNETTHLNDKETKNTYYFGLGTDTEPKPADRETMEREGSTKVTSSVENIPNADDGHKETLTLDKGGNMGVTTTQQMMSQELEIRKRNLAAEFVRMFADEYTFYEP